MSETFSDEQIECSDCCTLFTWTIGEQEFLAARQLREPKQVMPAKPPRLDCR